MNGFSRFSFSQSLIGIIILITILFLYQLDIKSHMHLNINFFNNACASNPICNAIGKWCKIEPLVHLTPLPPRERYNQPSYDIMYNRDKYLANLEMTQISPRAGFRRNFRNFTISLWYVDISVPEFVGITRSLSEFPEF